MLNKKNNLIDSFSQLDEKWISKMSDEEIKEVFKLKNIENTLVLDI